MPVHERLCTEVYRSEAVLRPSRFGRRCVLIPDGRACVTLVRSRFTGFQLLIDAEALGEDGGSAVVEEMKASRSSPRSKYCRRM